MELAPGITVNGVMISPDDINAEVQYHAAANQAQAKYQAMQALVIKELLLQEVKAKNINEEDIDSAIEALLEAELNVPVPDDGICLRYYEQNTRRFMTSPLFEVSHILYLAPPEDKEAYEEARQKAEKALTLIKADSKLFGQIAKHESACSSSGEAGRLGQIAQGQTMPIFEAALMKMNEGELSDEPLASEVGYHIIKVHKRAEGKQLPLDAVLVSIADYLEAQSWQVALNQYIQILAGKAEISGFQIKATNSPLVQ